MACGSSGVAGSSGQQCRQRAPPRVRLPLSLAPVPLSLALSVSLPQQQGKPWNLAEELPVPGAGGTTFSSEDTRVLRVC